MDKTVNYNGYYEFTNGNESCQDMASNFLRMMGSNEE